MLGCLGAFSRRGMGGGEFPLLLVEPGGGGGGC
jgi:hypothetical protein